MVDIGSIPNISNNLSGQWDNFWNGIGNVIGPAGLLVVQMMIVMSIVFFLYWFFIRNDIIVMVKSLTTPRWRKTKGRFSWDRKTRKRSFKVMGFPQYAEVPPREDQIHYVKTTFGVKKMVIFTYDRDNNLHPAELTESPGLLEIQVNTPLEQEVFVNQLEKANRKYRRTLEDWVQKVGFMMLIIAIVISGSAVYVTWKNGKLIDAQNRGIEVLSNSNTLLSRYVQGVYLQNVTGANSIPQKSGVDILTPFNNPG